MKDQTREQPPESVELHSEVIAPDGSRYEIAGVPKDWSLGTGDVMLDALAFIWAIVRRARGKEWTVSVRRAEPKSDDLVIKRRVRSRDRAVECISELVEALENGQRIPPAP
jgi:hypothetical protein